jgi:hypothetical protein
MDADPTVYDNFNNPAYEGSYNKDLWGLVWGPAQFAQQDGVMMFTQWGTHGVATDVAARRYRGLSLDRPTFFEARLMLSPDSYNGAVHIDLFTGLKGGWYSECQLIQNGEQWILCFDGLPEDPPHSYNSDAITIQSGSWHTVRMEVDPATMTFSYFVDGRLVGSHVADAYYADGLKEAIFRLEIGSYQSRAAGSSDVVIGYIDDVRFGPLQ